MIASSKNYLAVSSSANLANQLFAKLDKSKKFDFNSENYQRLRSKTPSSDEFGLFYCDIQKIVQLAPQLGFIDEQYKALLNLIPRQVLANFRMTDKLEQDFSMHLPKAEMPEELKNIFSYPAKNAWRNFPEKSFLAVNLNLNFLQRAFAYFAKLSPDKSLNEFMQFFPSSPEQQSSISFSLNNTNITGYPDAQLVVSAPGSDKLVQRFKTILGSQSAKSGLNKMDWQSKQIAGQATDFIATPFGVGLYLTETEDKLLLASSESALGSLLNPNNTLGNRINKELPAAADKPTAIFSSYIDYTEIYKIFMNFRNMLGMFIPPDSKQEANAVFEQLESLKRMGSIYFNSSYDGDVLDFDVVSQPVGKTVQAAS